MEEIKRVIECKKFNIELSRFDDDSSWINLINKDGGTCKQPYGFLNVEQLKQLKSAINAELKRIKTLS